MGYRLDWRGDDVYRRVTEASREAVDETNSAAMAKAKARTPVVTGAAQRSIRMLPATSGDGIHGRWGSFGAAHFIFLEIGTVFMRALRLLRSAADEEYPKLAGRIRARLR